MSVSNYIYPIPMTSINSTTFNNSYQAINPLGLPRACSILKLVNNSGVLVTVSWDGIIDHDIAPLGSLYLYDFQTNSQPNNDISLIKKGTIIYVKGAVSSTGSVYLVGHYNTVAN